LDPQLLAKEFLFLLVKLGMQGPSHSYLILQVFAFYIGNISAYINSMIIKIPSNYKWKKKHL